MRTGRLFACAVALAVASAALLGCTNPPPGGGGASTTLPPPSGGSTQKGADPTEDSLTASRGPFAIRELETQGDGTFNQGRIYYPTDTGQGRFGAVVIVPGFVSNQSSISWYGPRIASQGFVVMTIDTNSPLDFPAARATQQANALRWLTTQSPVANITDPTRLGAMGWSMGGGGTLEGARSNPNIKAAVPLAPWDTGSFGGVQKPTMIVACQSDTVAPVSSMSMPFYQSLGGEKAFLEMAGGSHFCVTTVNTTIARYTIAWLKRFVDDDTRYAPFICTTGTPAGASRYQQTCPL